MPSHTKTLNIPLTMCIVLESALSVNVNEKFKPLKRAEPNSIRRICYCCCRRRWRLFSCCCLFASFSTRLLFLLNAFFHYFICMRLYFALIICHEHIVILFSFGCEVIFEEKRKFNELFFTTLLSCILYLYNSIDLSISIKKTLLFIFKYRCLCYCLLVWQIRVDRDGILRANVYTV